MVQEPFSLGQALHDVLVDGRLVWQQGVELVYGPGLQAADPAVHHPQTLQMQDVVQGQHVGHDGGDEAGAVTLVLKLTSDLVGTAPQLGTQQHGLCKVPDVNWHAGLLEMSRGMAVAMCVVDEEMLVKENQIEDRDVLHGHRYLSPSRPVVACAVVPELLQQGHVFVLAITSRIELVDGVVLARIGRPELLRHLISPGHLDG